MMEERDFRNKVTWFNFVCCLLVIWTHSGNAELFLQGIGPDAPIMRFQYRVVPELVRVDIPCFLMLSGYLFYRNFTFSRLGEKWKRRVHSLLIPYLLWNTLYYAGYLAASQFEGLRGLINRPELSFSLASACKAIVKFEFNPVFWFMYQLIWLVLLTPVLYLFLKNVWTGALFLCCLFAALFAGVALPEVNLDALIYYSAAAYGALHGRTFVEASWTVRRAGVGVLLLAVGAAVGRSYYTNYFVPGIVLYQLLASVAFWLLVREDWLGKIRPFMTCTFFIYAFHFIPVRLLNKGMAAVFPGNGAVAMALFALMPLLAVLICWQSARFLRHFLPGVWQVINGGR